MELELALTARVSLARESWVGADVQSRHSVLNRVSKTH